MKHFALMENVDGSLCCALVEPTLFLQDLLMHEVVVFLQAYWLSSSWSFPGLRFARLFFFIPFIQEIFPMRTHILLTAFFGIAVSGCGTCQPALESCGGTGDNQPQEQFTSDCIPYAVIQTNDDGSFMIQYQTEVLVPRQRTFIDANGQEIVCTEMQRSYVEHTSTVAPGTDISEYLKVRAGGGTLDQEPDLHFDDYVDPAPAPPAPADAVILPELQVVTSFAASQSMDRALE